MIRIRLVALFIHSLVLVCIICYIITEFKNDNDHKNKLFQQINQQILLEKEDAKLIQNEDSNPNISFDSEQIFEKNDENIFQIFNNLPEIIKSFQDHQKNNFPKLCQNYWKKSVKSLISKYKTSSIINSSNHSKSLILGPSFQIEEMIKYLSYTTINDDITMIKLRFKYIFDSINRKILEFEPIISCIPDQRIPKVSKLKQLKIRDINHTIKYIFKAIQKNSIEENENNNENNSLKYNNHIRYLDLLIHYDDCPIIWKSMPFHIYKNDTLHIEKCILNSKFSKQMQFLLSNTTEIHHVFLKPQQQFNSKCTSLSTLISYNNNDNSNNNSNMNICEDSTVNVTNQSSNFTSYSSSVSKSYFLSFNHYQNQNNNNQSIIQNDDQNYHQNNGTIFSSLINNHLTTYTICEIINNFVKQIISILSRYHIPEIMCYGTIKCYIPCFFQNNNSIFTSIFDKLKKRDIFKLFNHLHCICQFNPKNSPNSSGLILSISSNSNSWDFASIPYVNHLDNNELIARSFISNEYPNNNKDLWNLKNNTLFFIGRYTDTSRLDLSCNIYNEIYHNNFHSGNISNHVFISDSNKISCENRANLLEKLTLCDSKFICRKESISFIDWINRLVSSKFSLDLSGVGPWSNRLRMLMLTGTMIFQNIRSYYSHQFYDLLFKKNRLFFKFNNISDILLNVNLILENPQISSNISKITSNFAHNCLSEEGIAQYFKTLLFEFGYWDLDSLIFSNNTNKHSFPFQNFTEIKFSPKDNLKTIRNKIETCLG
ncbi:transmembrane domain-containing protein near C, signal peptide [Cryptosporidium parvum]